MAYGTPADPVAGTVITVAYAVANILDPIRWLRQLTGNADPPGSNYWLKSTSTTAVSWVDRAAEALAAIGYTPVNKAGDTMTGSLNVSGATSDVSVGRNLGVTGGVSAASASLSGAGTALAVTNNASVGGTATIGTLSVTANGAINGTATLGAAAVGTTLSVGSNATVGGTLGVTATSTLGVTNTGTLTSSGVVQGTRLTSTQATGTAPLTVSSTTEVANLNASRVAGKIPTATPAASALPLADGSGKLDDWITAFPTLAGGGDFSTAPTINGDAIAKIATGNYPGDNADGRQITTGFICKQVDLFMVNGSVVVRAGVYRTSTGTTVLQVNNGVTSFVSTSANTVLHASDGFVVDASGQNALNISGNTYYWVALG